MQLTQPADRPELQGRLAKTYQALNDYLVALSKKELPETFIGDVNEHIEQLNGMESRDKGFKKELGKRKKAISDASMKELKLVPKHFYRTLWMAAGMSAFGLPVGVILSLAIDNFAFVGVGLPIGFAIGIALGSGMDQKAAKEGRQLDIEVSR